MSVSHDAVSQKLFAYFLGCHLLSEMICVGEILGKGFCYSPDVWQITTADYAFLIQNEKYYYQYALKFNQEKFHFSQDLKHLSVNIMTGKSEKVTDHFFRMPTAVRVSAL